MTSGCAAERAGITSNANTDKLAASTSVENTDTQSTNVELTQPIFNTPPRETDTTAPAAVQNAPAATAGGSNSTVTVARVIDGDTVELADSQRVRLIGIDTPERGECGYREATERLIELIGNQPVTLTAGARSDTDRYGRLLRYLDIGDTDAGLKLLQAGLAISRYDSRDGYGSHPREAQYIAADDLTTQWC